MSTEPAPRKGSPAVETAAGRSIAGVDAPQPLQGTEPLQGRAGNLGEAGARLQGERRPSWYREPSVLISLLALFLSFVATALTQVESSRAWDRETRQQLTTYLQQLAELERQPGATSTDYLLLADQAAELMGTIPASAVQHILVAEAFVAASEHERAVEEFKLAEQRATTLVELVTIQRGVGFARMQADDAPGGRSDLERALQLVSSDRFSDAPAAVRAQLAFDTHLLWADAEMRRHECEEAAKHVDQARRISEDEGADVMTSHVVAFEERISSCQPS